MTVETKESILNCKGLELAIKTYSWPENSSIPVLALHGWLDNAATFDALAPLMENIQLIAVDFPGHGLSSHRAEGAEYYIWSYVEDLIAVANALELEEFYLLGHSMGGGVACLMSSLYPNRVKKLALLDAVGPMTTAAEDAPAQMIKALKHKRTARPRHYYPTREAAVEARAKKGITMSSASLLGSRGIAEDEQGYYWVNDKRLSQANLLSMTEEQVDAFFKEVNCPSLLIASSWSQQERFAPYKKRIAKLGFKGNFETCQLDGNHHQHLEGQVEAVADRLNEFFKQ